MVSCQSEATLHKSQRCAASPCRSVLNICPVLISADQIRLFFMIPALLSFWLFFSVVNRLQASCGMTDRVLKLSWTLTELFTCSPREGPDRLTSGEVCTCLLLCPRGRTAREPPCHCPPGFSKAPWGKPQVKGLSASIRMHTQLFIKSSSLPASLSSVQQPALSQLKQEQLQGCG